MDQNIPTEIYNEARKRMRELIKNRQFQGIHEPSNSKNNSDVSFGAFTISIYRTQTEKEAGNTEDAIAKITIENNTVYIALSTKFNVQPNLDNGIPTTYTKGAPFIKWPINNEKDIDTILNGKVSPFFNNLSSEQAKKALMPINTNNHENDDASEVETTNSNGDTYQNHLHQDNHKNIILYGPPGTGKTYSTIDRAIKIIDPEYFENDNPDKYHINSPEYKAARNRLKNRYNELIKDKRIAFTTFHQNYGYEDFIEGIKPNINQDEQDTSDHLDYIIEPGIFTEFCDIAITHDYPRERNDFGINNHPTIWKISLRHTGDNPIRQDCLTNNRIRIGWDSYGEISEDTNYDRGGRREINAFINGMQIGDIVISCYSKTLIDAIGVITGDYQILNTDEYTRSRNVNWLIRYNSVNEMIDIRPINNNKVMVLSAVYKLSSISLSDIMDLINNHASDSPLHTHDAPINVPKYVFIIDEINRGNISKIFGELITLIEDDKRKDTDNEQSCILPYSRKKFTVPSNVYILGTMNTADRSLTRLDTALRRRFVFEEMMPRSDLLSDITIEGINLGALLTKMNERIEALYDREHQIGHAYFVKLNNDSTMQDLAKVMQKKILPLLQEYFFDDWNKIQLVLGDNQKRNNEPQFIEVVNRNSQGLFGTNDIECNTLYRINESAFTEPNAYTFLR